jgi:hypothetical protein
MEINSHSVHYYAMSITNGQQEMWTCARMGHPPDEEETKRSSLFGNFNFVYFKTVVGMLDGISECIFFHVLILQIVFI